MLIITPDYLTQTIAPTTEIVTRTEAKNHLRVDITSDDTLIDNLIIASRQYCELYTNRAFRVRTSRADVSHFDDTMRLPFSPIISVGSVKYWSTDSPSTLTTLATTHYELSRNYVSRKYNGVWPSVFPRPDAVQITYTHGYQSTTSPATTEPVPVAVKAAALLIIGDLYENREGQVLYPGQIQENKTVQMLLSAYRVYQ